MTDMPRYKSHKIVQAAPICGIVEGNVYVIIAGKAVQTVVPENFFARGTPNNGDYLVAYDDGYLSWSPKQTFEDGYTAVQE